MSDMERPSRGAIENRIADAVSRFQREQHGRGSANVRVHIIENLVVVHSSGIFTPTETRLLVSEEGRRLVKSSRHELRSLNHEEIENIVAEIAGCKVLHSFFDAQVQAGEQIEVYVLEHSMEKQWAKA